MRLFAAIVYVSPILWMSQCLPAVAASTPKQAKKANLTMEQFTAKLINEGTAMQLVPSIAKLVDLSPDSPNRSLSVESEETTDGWYRAARVILRDRDGKQEPGELYWSLQLKAKERKEVYYYRTSLDGTLNRAVRLDGKLSADGKPIRGSGSVAQLDVNAKDVQEKFRERVLDFWLKGKYRSKIRSK